METCRPRSTETSLSAAKAVEDIAAAKTPPIVTNQRIIIISCIMAAGERFNSAYRLCKQHRWRKRVEIRKLKPGFEALGVLIDFLAREPPYAQLRAADLLAAVTYQ